MGTRDELVSRAFVKTSVDHQPPKGPQGVDVEIIGDGTDVVIPKRVRINGVEVLVPTGRAITVDDIKDTDIVVVTVPMIVRNLTVKSDG